MRFRLDLSSALTLRRAATLVFATMAILPTLLLVYLLSRADLLRRTETQAGLLVELVVSVVGFLVLRRMMDQITRVAQGLHDSVMGRGVAPVAPARPTGPPAFSDVTEIAQLGNAFYRMLDDLRGATARLEDLVFKLGTLNETVELAARIPKIQDLLGLVLNNTMRAVRATIGSIMILDKERQTLRLAASRGLSEEAAAQVDVRVGEGIAGKVVELGHSILVEDIETDPRFQKPSAPHYGNGSFICMPIRAGDRVVGVLNMAKARASVDGGESRPEPFTPTELQFLNTLLTYIGYSVDNARLLEEARQSAQRLQDVVNDLRATQSAAVRRETLRAIGQLSSGVAHHLNNLFAVILGRTELLLLKVAQPENRRALEIVLSTAQDGAEVVRRVQRFSRAEPVSESGPVDLNQVAREVVELTRPRWYDEAQLRGIRIEAVIDAGQIPPAAVESAPLREVLMNLVLNAVDAMPKGGKIGIKTWAAGARVCCAVTDVGVGMSDEIRRQALEPFFTTKGPKSLGLGLSVAYGTIQRHGGTLVVDSVEGHGTTVTISLPVAERPAPAARVELRPPQAPLRILVIDDDPRVRATLAEILEAQGHAVVQASGGQEALSLLERKARVDVVLTDLGMPDMTGWDLARAVRERWPGLKLGLITGWSNQELPPDQRSRVDFLIEKPFESTQLHEMLLAVHSRPEKDGGG